MFCNHCGFAIPANAVFCERCGHQVLGDISSMEAAIKPPADKRNDTFATIRLTAILTPILMIILFLLGIVMHSEGTAIYYVLAGMGLVGVGWWFWRKVRD